jgi:hypothetical protein
VFTNEKAVIDDVSGSPVPAVPSKKLKELIRKTGKTSSMGMDKVRSIESVAGEPG